MKKANDNDNMLMLENGDIPALDEFLKSEGYGKVEHLTTDGVTGSCFDFMTLINNVKEMLVQAYMMELNKPFESTISEVMQIPGFSLNINSESSLPVKMIEKYYAQLCEGWRKAYEDGEAIIPFYIVVEPGNGNVKCDSDAKCEDTSTLTKMYSIDMEFTSLNNIFAKHHIPACCHSPWKMEDDNKYRCCKEDILAIYDEVMDKINQYQDDLATVAYYKAHSPQYDRWAIKSLLYYLIRLHEVFEYKSIDDLINLPLPLTPFEKPTLSCEELRNTEG